MLGDQLKKVPFAILICLSLSSCAASQAQSQLQQRLQIEGDAWKQAHSKALTTCFSGKTEEEAENPKRDEAVKSVECISKIVNETVAPVALYPDLLLQRSARALRNADAYSKGDISLEEYHARGQESVATYLQQVNSRANASIYQAAQQEALQRQHFQQSFQQSLAAQQAMKQQQIYQPQPTQSMLPKQTHCTTFNGTMDCTTY